MRHAAAGLALVGLAGCLGTGTGRIDAPCREMRSAVVWEMLKDNPTIPVLDLRRRDEVTGAVRRLPRGRSYPLEKLASRVPELEGYKETTIIVFGLDGETGRKGCQLLSDRGFRYVIFISDGALGWFLNGLPAGAPSREETPVPTPPAGP